VKCGPGTYWDSATTLCIDCAKGYYTDLDGQTSCIECTTGFTTETAGTYDANMCYSKSTVLSIKTDRHDITEIHVLLKVVLNTIILILNQYTFAWE
jgi:hypothetical protein